MTFLSCATSTSRAKRMPLSFFFLWCDVLPTTLTVVRILIHLIIENGKFCWGKNPKDIFNVEKAFRSVSPYSNYSWKWKVRKSATIRYSLLLQCTHTLCTLGKTSNRSCKQVILKLRQRACISGVTCLIVTS